MIIFDLDGTLADCEHRRHFVDPSKNKDYKETLFICDCSEYVRNPILDEGGMLTFPRWVHVETGKYFQPDWQAFYEACSEDKPIEPVIKMLNLLSNNHEIQIWSGRCESVRDKTIGWLCENEIIPPLHTFEIKMRPIGDTTPDDVLKEKWLGEFHDDNMIETKWGNKPTKTIDFVFDDRPKVIRMWQRRGIFVFNCCQHDKEF